MNNFSINLFFNLNQIWPDNLYKCYIWPHGANGRWQKVLNTSFVQVT